MENVVTAESVVEQKLENILSSLVSSFKNKHPEVEVSKWASRDTPQFRTDGKQYFPPEFKVAVTAPTLEAAAHKFAEEVLPVLEKEVTSLKTVQARYPFMYSGDRTWRLTHRLPSRPVLQTESSVHLSCFFSLCATPF